MAEPQRGISDSSKAMVASSVNGGGVLPPPTPPEKISDALSGHMTRAVKGPKPTNYVDELPESLAWRTTTQTMMVSGLAGEVTEEELAKVPENLTSSPICQKRSQCALRSSLEPRA